MSTKADRIELTEGAGPEPSKPQPMGPSSELLAEARRAARDPATEISALLLELFHEYKGRMISLAAQYGLSGPPQMGAIQALAREMRPVATEGDDQGSAVPMSALAKALQCDPSNVTGIVDRLEARGLVERRSAPDDRRVKMIALTPKGAELHEQIGERMLRPPEAITRLTAGEQRRLRDLLRKAIGG